MRSLVGNPVIRSNACERSWNNTRHDKLDALRMEHEPGVLTIGGGKEVESIHRGAIEIFTLAAHHCGQPRPNRTLFYGVAEQIYRFSLLVCGASARPPSTDYTLVMKSDNSLHFPPAETLAETTTRRRHRC
jgi:hypothetical protein